MKKFLIIGLVIASSVLWSNKVVLADEATDISSEAVLVEAVTTSAEDAQVVTSDELEDLDGVETVEPTNMPTSFGLWWQGVKETISLAVTRDPVKKAEMQLKFAEERVKLANYIAENSSDPVVQEKAAKIVAKADALMQKIEAKSGDFLANLDERKQKLLANTARHELNKEKVLNRLEDKSSLENLPELEKIKATIQEKTNIFLEKIASNENIPAEVKARITARKEAIAERQTERAEMRAENKELLDKALAGDESAKAELQAQREEQAKKREEIRNEFKEKTQELINKVQTGTVQGPAQALKELRKLHELRSQAVEAINNQMQGRNRVQNQVELVAPEVAE